ncbi:hypothetical protein IAE39_000563 [Pseudomonas sp. S37]|nr:hypothetical protein [Pseudomonas sp. S37]
MEMRFYLAAGDRLERCQKISLVIGPQPSEDVVELNVSSLLSLRRTVPIFSSESGVWLFITSQQGS